MLCIMLHLQTYTSCVSVPFNTTVNLDLVFR
jgi:hypothetical protein